MPQGTHGLEYEVVAGWEQLPEGWSFTEAVGAAVDSKDRVYVFCRGKRPLIIFDKEGRFLNAWGEGIFTRPHGIFIDGLDKIWLVDAGDHTIRVFSAEGQLLRTIGEPHRASDTGFQEGSAPVQYASGPFNRVTNVAVLPDGGMYVADGYGNARVHHFNAQGELVRSWGKPGSEPGCFNLPHGIAVDSAGTVYVCDRENSRMQLFDAQGEYLRSWEFLNRPADIFIDAQDRIYIAELGFRNDLPEGPHYQFMADPPHGHDPLARVSICEPDGALVARIGGEEEVLPGNFIAPHGIWADSRGELYIGEVVVAANAVKRLAPMTPQTFQKFRRVTDRA